MKAHSFSYHLCQLGQRNVFAPWMQLVADWAEGMRAAESVGFTLFADAHFNYLMLMWAK